MAVAALTVVSGVARAQDAPRIAFPQEGQAVRGEITTRFENVPQGGYVIIKVDGQFKTASAQPTYTLNTFLEFPNGGTHRISITAIDASGRNVGASEVSFNVANTQVDTSQQGVILRHWVLQDRLNESVQRYRVFAQSDADISESTSGGAGGGSGGLSAGGAGGRGGASLGGSSAGGGGAGGAGSGAEVTESPLDWQVVALVRRVVRDVGLVDGSANIRYAIAQAYQRQRLGAGGGGAGGSESGGASAGGSRSGGGGGSSLSGGGGGSASGGAEGSSAGKGNTSLPGSTVPTFDGPGKAPWNYELVPVDGTRNKVKHDVWDIAKEVGQYNVKMIMPSGGEINATRKVPTLALVDLLPTFPQEKVFPGSTWLTSMTFVGDLFGREPISVRDAPMSFSNYDTIITPAGQRVRCAKLESYFNLPNNDALELAGKLNQSAGTSGGAGGGGDAGGGLSLSGGARGGGGGGGAAAGGGANGEEADPTADIQTARTKVSRIIWFDIAGRRIVRAEDTVNTFYQLKQDASAAAGGGGAAGGAVAGGGAMMGGRGGLTPGGAPGAAGGADAPPAEPTRVNYNLRVTTYLDDTVPPISDSFGYVRPKIGNAHNPIYSGNRDRSIVRDPSIGPLLR